MRRYNKKLEKNKERLDQGEIYDPELYNEGDLEDYERKPLKAGDKKNKKKHEKRKI